MSYWLVNQFSFDFELLKVHCVTWKADIFVFSFTCTIDIYEMTIESFDGKQNLKRAACKIVLLDLSPLNVDFSALSN